MTLDPAAPAIVPMVLDDIPAVVAIENCSFPTLWSAGSFRHELLENPHAMLFVIRAQKPPGVIGFGCIWVVDREMKINNIAIHPLVRRRGFGSRLLQFVLDLAVSRGCRNATLEVRPGNAPALAMYGTAGFRVVGRHKDYYGDTHEDALLMSRSLTPSKEP